MTKLQIAAALSLVSSLACVRPQMIVQKKYPPTTPEQVQVFVEEPKEPYETLALISITVDEGQSFTDFALRHMKASAASIGGEALIINASSSVSQGGVAVPVGNTAIFGLANGQGISGKVIRFKRAS